MANRIPTASRLHPNIQKLFSISSASKLPKAKFCQVTSLGLGDRSQLPRPENHVFQVEVGANQVVAVPWNHLANEAGARKIFQAALNQHLTNDLGMYVQLDKLGTVYQVKLVAKPESKLLGILQGRLRAAGPAGRAIQKHHATNPPNWSGSSS